MKTFLLLVTVYILINGVQNLSIKSNGSRIIGGEEAYAGQFPFAAAIYKTTPDGTYFCTGTLLNNEWIITAGQCVYNAISFTILLGTHKLDGDDATVEKLATNEYVLHPEYDPETLKNDLGLIKLRMPVTYTDYIKNIILPLFSITGGARGITFGWGHLTDDSVDLSNTLNFVDLESIKDDECRLYYGNQFQDSMICYAGNYNEGTCIGDSGSPAIMMYRNNYLINAVSSFHSGNGCESTDPSGYTKVYPYLDWIRGIIA